MALVREMVKLVPSLESESGGAMAILGMLSVREPKRTPTDI